MRRPLLRKLATAIAREVEGKPYDYWCAAELPLVSERSFKGRTVQVKIDMLERTNDYVHLIVSVSGDNTTSYFPVSDAVIVENPTAPRPEGQKDDEQGDGSHEATN